MMRRCHGDNRYLHSSKSIAFALNAQVDRVNAGLSRLKRKKKRNIDDFLIVDSSNRLIRIER